MMESDVSVYLNQELHWGWPGFETTNLEKGADGRLTLARVPRATEILDADPDTQHPTSNIQHPGPCPDPTAPTPNPQPPTPAPAGIAATGDCACDLYISDPVGHRIWRYDACVGEPVALPYIQGPGIWPGQVTAPRGLAVVEAHGGARLIVADSGNHRLQVIDCATQQPLAVWGQPDPTAPPMPGSAPGRLDTPTDLVADSDGNIYVVDYGNTRVQKFGPTGQVIPTFWETMAAAPTRPERPAALALSRIGDTERLYVLDTGGTQAHVCAFATDGTPQPPAYWPVPAPLDLGGPATPVALAATADAVYVGGADGTIVRYTPDGTVMGTMQLGRPLAALAVGCDGELLAGGGGLPVVRLSLEGGYVPAGWFRVGPFPTLAQALAWHRWRVLADPQGAPWAPAAHVQLFTYSSLNPAPPPDAGGDNPFAAPGWYAQPRDELDVLILSTPIRDVLAAGPAATADDQDDSAPQPAYFWLGGLLRGDGTTSPILHQMRVDYTPDTGLRYLPSVYRRGEKRRLFLDLLLATLGSELGRVDETLAALPARFDPAAAPAAGLPWLASWLDFDLVEDWPTVTARHNLADAVQLATLRGTAEGLRRYLAIYAGVSARIEEPGAVASLFALDENVALGFNTMLAPAHEQGAVLASTATLGQSHLLDVEDSGAPLFADVANRFCVQVYAAEMADPRTQDQVIAVLEREKPAHTEVHLCVIEAKMRVGFQACIGVNSIVGGPAPDLRLGDPGSLGTDTVLADQPPRADRVGYGIRVGATL